MEWLNQKLLSDAGVDVSTLDERNEEITAFTIPGGKPAVDLWMKLSAEARELGGWPLLAGDADESRRHWEDRSQEAGRRATILAAVPAVPKRPPIAAMADEKRLMRERMMEYLKQHAPPSFVEIMVRNSPPEPAGARPDFSKWPSEPPSPSGRYPSTAFDYVERKPLAACSLLIVKTSVPADTPAYLSFGGFNDCPSPAVHVAFLRDWNRRFGAVPIAVTHDVVELYLPRPIAGRQEAFDIAVEQYQYAPDIVDQGTQTVDELAREIWGSPYWFFWWD